MTMIKLVIAICVFRCRGVCVSVCVCPRKKTFSAEQEFIPLKVMQIQKQTVGS